MKRLYISKSRGIYIDPHDTNLSWRLIVALSHDTMLQWDWWYDRASRKRLWMPFEFWFFHRGAR